MKNLRNTTLVVLLTLVGLLMLPMWPHSGAITSAQQGNSGTDCVQLPPKGDDRARTATSRNPKFCTPTPNATPSPDPTSAPTTVPTNAPTHAPTNTPTTVPTNVPTNTPTTVPTNTPIDTRTPVPPANITVYNTGSFFVQYYVSYNLPGLPLQSLYSGVFNINQGITLTIPGAATNVGVLIQGYTGITGWQAACTRTYAQAINAVIIVSGTTFIPACTG